MTPQERAELEAELASLKERSELEAELAELKQQVQSQSSELEPLTRNQQLRAGGQQAYDELGPVDKFGVGVAKGALNTYYGIKDLFTDLSPDEQDSLERLAGTEGGFLTAGEVASDLATFAIPGAKLGQFMSKIATKAPQLIAKIAPRIAPVLADLGITVGAEGLKAPTSEMTRGERMTDAAQGYIATAAGLRFLGNLKKGLKGGAVTATKAAEELMAKGIKLTPGQATEGKNSIINAIENIMEFTPFGGAKVTEMKTRNLTDWNKKLLDDPKVNPLSDTPIKEAGEKGFKALQDNFKVAYDDVWGSVKQDDLDFGQLSNTLNNAMTSAGENIAANDVNPVKGIIKNAAKELQQFYKTGDVKALERADDLFKLNPKMDYSSQQLLKNVRDEIRGTMPGDTGTRLADIDTKYANYSVLQRGGSYVDALKNNQELSPVNLFSAVKAKGKERALTTSEALMQKEAQTGIDVLGNYRPKNSVLRKSLGALAAYGEPITALSTMAATSALAKDSVSDFILKGVPQAKQKALADVLRKTGSKTGVTSAVNKINEIAPKLTPDEINKLLMRSGGYYGASGEDED